MSSSSSEADDDAPPASDEVGRRFGRRNHVELRLDENRFLPAVIEIDDLGWFHSRTEDFFDDVEKTVAKKVPLDDQAKKPVEGIAYGSFVWIKYRVVHQPQAPFTLLMPRTTEEDSSSTDESKEYSYSQLEYCGFRLEARVMPYLT